MEDNKGKNIELPPSGLPDDLSKIGSSFSIGSKKTSEPMPAWKAILGVFVVIGLLAFLGALTPKGGTPEDAIATQAAGLTSQAVARAKASPTNTPRPTVTPYPDITMTPTATHTADEEITSLKMLPAVKSVEFVERRGTDYWAGVTVWPKFNKESFAQLLMGQAIKVDGYTFRFAVRIDDEESEPRWWIYSQSLDWTSSSTPPAWADLEPLADEQIRPATAATIAPTKAPSQTVKLKTYYVGSTGANLRSCPKTSCGTVTSLIAGTSISSLGEVDGDAVNTGNAMWYRVSYGGKDAYVYSGVVSTTKPTSSGNTSNGGSTGGTGASNTTLSTTQNQSVPTAQSPSVCPANCTEARAMGISPEAAAACGLDRDGDGQACYADK